MMKIIPFILAIAATYVTALPLLLPLPNVGSTVPSTVGSSTTVPGDVGGSNPYNNPQEQCRVTCVQGSGRCEKECPPAIPGTNEVYGPHTPQYQIDAVKDATTEQDVQTTVDSNPAPQEDPATADATNETTTATSPNQRPELDNSTTDPANTAGGQPQVPATAQN